MSTGADGRGQAVKSYSNVDAYVGNYAKYGKLREYAELNLANKTYQAKPTKQSHHTKPTK